MSYVMTFLGHEAKYWMELQERVYKHGDAALDIERLINEIADLRAKVSFYESRIKEMTRLCEK